VMLQELFEGWWTETLHRRQARHHKFPFVLVVGRVFFVVASNDLASKAVCEEVEDLKHCKTSCVILYLSHF
jgi:hypothetical protein